MQTAIGATQLELIINLLGMFYPTHKPAPQAAAGPRQNKQGTDRQRASKSKQKWVHLESWQCQYTENKKRSNIVFVDGLARP